MTLLYILSYFSLLIQVCLLTIAIASGLYYIADLVEEYTVLAKRVITSMIIGTTILYTLFIFFDNLTWMMIICGLGSQILHGAIMKDFPYVEFVSISFIGAIILLVVNHVLAFQYFSSVYYSFSEVMGYFTLCLWLVPFALFVSLSSNDNVLPTINEKTPLLDNNDVVSSYFSGKRKKHGLRNLFNYAKDALLPQINKKSF